MPNPTPEPAASSATATPRVELVQETRLAVVMYGGVSLAIYINGIAQELLRLVRATSPAASDPTRPHLPQNELTSTEPIYRLLGQVSHGIGLGRPTASGMPSLDQILARPEDHPIRTRFVVDVLSGTSAGGLNAVYLAKALANDQSLEGLKRLWISDGDVRTLLNDRASIEGFSHLSVQRPPRSLLNSERMYLLLLSALDQMRSDRPADATSPYADELDLYVTTTDIVGYPVRLDLGDHTVDERRHRHVFHLRYAAPETGGGEPMAPGASPRPPRPASAAGSTPPDSRAATAKDLEHRVRNDFRDAQNRFLAFVARCTSSFPFAFEAATLEDLDPLLYRSRRDFEKDIGNWERFFGRHLRGGGGDFGVRAPDPTDACLRAYSDGGILDNRPFSYATDALLRRTSSVPVDRKLLYLEPVPRHNAPDSREKPDALTTALLALTSVPGYESIRADLERVIERNRSILRLRDVHRMVEQDLRDATPADLALLSSEGFESLSVPELLRRHGPAYGPYHRLKTATLSDEFSVVVSRALGFGDFDVERAAVGYLVRAWVRERYPELQPPATASNAAPSRNQSQLLKRFDISYRLRRLRFLRLRIRELNALDDNAIAILKPWLPPELFAEFRDERDAPGMAREVRAALREIAGSIDRAYARLRATGRALRTPVHVGAEARPPAEVPPEKRTHRLAVTLARWEIAEALRGAQVTGKELRNLMRLAERDRDDLAAEMVARPSSVAALEALETALRKVLDFEMGEAKKVVRTALDASGPDLSPVQRGLRRLLLRYYTTYQAYDFATLPFTWGTEIGEADFVDIVRVSPEDSRSLIDELQDRAAEELLEGRLSGRSDRLRRKLAGNQLANFGAFLDELWRRNDMMWGRLDAAEQIVDMTLPANMPGRRGAQAAGVP